jgi:hypothetical protein
MPNVVTLRDRNVTAKGLNKDNIIDKSRLKEYFLSDDYEKLSLLDNIKLDWDKEELTLFYPGCGSDILFPLLYLDKLFPGVRKIQLNFVDVSNFLGLIKTILDDVGINFSESFVEGKDNINFYWKGKLINLTFVQDNVFDYIDKIELFDLYFERAFRIMKDDDPDFEQKVVTKLSSDGMIISDSGFQGLELNYLDASRELSSYNEMVIGVKK